MKRFLLFYFFLIPVCLFSQDAELSIYGGLYKPNLDELNEESIAAYGLELQYNITDYGAIALQFTHGRSRYYEDRYAFIYGRPDDFDGTNILQRDYITSLLYTHRISLSDKFRVNASTGVSFILINSESRDNLQLEWQDGNRIFLNPGEDTFATLGFPIQVSGDYILPSKKVAVGLIGNATVDPDYGFINLLAGGQISLLFNRN